PETIHRAREIGYEAGLQYVYTGNLPGDQGEKTHCHACGGLLIDRFGFTVRENRIAKGRCPECDVAVPGLWQELS
ncbi:MAG: radical SAM protein, partial [Pseudomonadota bacterium]